MQLGDGPGRVGGEINKRVGQPECVGAGVGRGVGVHEHDGPASLQLVEQRSEARVAQVGAAGVAEQHDAIQPEVVEGVGQFGERAVDVRQRQAGEAAEPVGAVADHLGGQFIAPSCQAARGGVVPGMYTRGADRGDGDVDAGVVEERERTRARPGRRRDTADRVVALVGGPPEEIGQHVVVDVHGEGHSRSACVDALVDALGEHDDGIAQS